MFIYYVRLSLRHLRKFWLTNLLSVGGLTLAFALALLVFMRVMDHVRAGSEVAAADRVYAVNTLISAGGGRIFSYQGMRKGSFDAWQASKNVEYIAGNQFATVTISHNGERYAERIDQALADYNKIFARPVIAGDWQQATSTLGMIAISERLAVKLFGSADSAMGQELQGTIDASNLNYVVGAVYPSPKAYEISQVNMVTMANVSALESLFAQGFYLTSHVRLREGVSITDMDKDIASIINVDAAEGKETKFASQSYLPSVGTGVMAMLTPSSYRSTGLMAAIAAFLFLTGVLNHVVLTTGLAQARGREIALRKVAGASRQQLMAQYMSESLLITLLAFGLAVILAVDFAESLSPILGQNIDPLAEWRSFELGIGLTMAVLTGLLAAVYPAWQAFRASIAGTLQTLGRGNSSGGGSLRRSLVVIQSFLGAGLLCFAWIAEDQMRYLEAMDRGYEARHLHALKVGYSDTKRLPLMHDQALALPGVFNAAYSGTGPYGEGSSGFQFLKVVGHPAPMAMAMNYANQQTLDMLGISLLAGEAPKRAKYRDEEVDGVKYIGYDVMITEEAFGKSGIPETADQALGHCIATKGQQQGVAREVCHRIVGIMPKLRHDNGRANFGDTPTIYYGVGPEEFSARTLLLHIDPLQFDETKNALKAIFEEVYPNGIFRLSSAQDQFDDVMRDQVAIRVLVQVAAMAIVMMALVGIYSLIRFDVARRAREIAVRRVLGANNGQVVWALLKLTGPLLVFGAIGGVVAGWLLGKSWLTTQALQTNLQSSLAIYAFSLITLLYLIAVATEVRRATSLRPSHVLHAE